MKGWSSRSLGRDWQHRFFYRMISLGGRRTAYFCLYPVVAWYVVFSGEARRRCSYYLSRRFPGAGAWQRLKNRYLLILTFGKVLVDRALVGILGAEQIRVESDLNEVLLGLLSEQRGMILINAHVGCWQVAMSALGFMETPVSLLMQREDGDIDRHYFDHSGTQCPYRIIDPRGYLGGSLEMYGVLKRGEVLSVMGDRMLGEDRNGVPVPFMGGEVLMPVSAYKLASATGAPIVVLLSIKTGADSYGLKLYDVIRVPPQLGRDNQSYVPYVSRFAGSLEKFSREHPFQFFNFFNMW